MVAAAASELDSQRLSVWFNSYGSIDGAQPSKTECMEQIKFVALNHISPYIHPILYDAH